LGGQGGHSLLVGFPVLIAKGDLTVLEFEEAVVAEGHAEDIGGEIFQGGLATADRLTIDDPILLPDLRWDLGVEGSVLEGVTELGTEDLPQGLDRDQKLAIFGWEPPLAIGREAPGRYEIMDMGMVPSALTVP
jgi:hypothetical protein